MRADDEYQEYAEPQLEKPVRLTHKWILIDQAQKVQKFRCSKCKATKIIVTLNSRYPIIRYQIGALRFDRAPECAK